MLFFTNRKMYFFHLLRVWICEFINDKTIFLIILNVFVIIFLDILPDVFSLFNLKICIIRLKRIEKQTWTKSALNAIWNDISICMCLCQCVRVFVLIIFQLVTIYFVLHFKSLSFFQPTRLLSLKSRFFQVENFTIVTLKPLLYSLQFVSIHVCVIGVHLKLISEKLYVLFDALTRFMCIKKFCVERKKRIHLYLSILCNSD